MTKKYTNLNRLKRSETLTEFKNFVNGMTNTESTPMFNAKDAVSNMQAGNKLPKTIIENLSEFSDEELLDISQAYLGTDGSCYFISDLFSGAALRSINLSNKVITNSSLLKSINIIHDKDPSKNISESNKNTINKSVKSSMQYGNINGDIKKKEKDGKDKEGNQEFKEVFTTAGGFDLSDNPNRIKQENQAGFLDINSNPSDPNRITEPSLGAIVFNDGTFGLPTRGQDEVAVFFNLINNIEMSLCSPYVYIKIISPKKEGKENISLEKTFRFGENPNGIGVAIDRKVEKNLLGSAGNASLDSLTKSQSIDYAFAGLELFTSPQTVSNSDIRRGDAGNEVLQPISSLLSLENIDITISGLGIGLFASKVARMKFTLHDKSRLPDISELVAVEEFGQTKIILEYGWHHPHGDINSDNVFGQFLNTLRDGGVFNVTKTSFSINDSSATIDVDLAMVGSREMTNVSAAGGVKVQSRVFKPLLEKIVEEEILPFEKYYKSSFKNNNATETTDSAKKALKEVRKVGRIAVNEASSRDSLMSREKFERFLSLHYKKNLDNNLKDQLREEIEDHFRINVTDLSSNRERTTQSDMRSNLVREISKKIAAIKDPGTDDPFIDQTLKSVTGLQAGVGSEVSPDESNPLRESTGFNLSEIYSLEKVDENPNRKNSFRDKYTSLGRVLMSFVGVPLATIGQYDEVQMLFYPLNHQSAGGHIFNMASFPIQIEKLVEVINNEIKSNQNISIKRMCILLERIMRDPQNEVYLIKSEVSKISDLRKINKSSLDKAFKQSTSEESFEPNSATKGELKSREIWELVNRITNGEGVPGKNYNKLLKPDELTKSDVNDIVNEIVEMHQENINNMLLKIYKSSDLYTEDIIEAKFVIPNMSVYFETCNPFIIRSDNSKEVDTERTILKVHIYDEETVSNKKAQLLQNIITQGSMTISGEVKEKYIAELENNPTKKDIKSLIKSSMPSLTLGSNMGQVTNFSISANTSGDTSQALMITSFLKNKNIMNDYDSAPNIDDMRVVPTTANIDMMGFPLLQRGQQIYIDAKTNTTADNIYVVQSVNHSISAGSFKTSADLTYTGTVSHSNIKTQLIKALKE